MGPPKVVERSERLSGKVALITGAGSGIGKECARMFARHSAKVIGTDLNADAAKATADEAARDAAPLLGTFACDLTDEESVASLISSASGLADGIDILVNAGAFAAMRWIEEMSLEEWRATLAGELDVVFLACRAVWPSMKKRGGGSIVNFSSANSHMALAGSPALAHCAGKGGVLAMTHQLAMEGAPFGIRANSIAPALVKTGATATLLADPEVAEILKRKHMIQRIGEPSDIAWVALFLASDESAWITATEIRVDGGATHFAG